MHKLLLSAEWIICTVDMALHTFPVMARNVPRKSLLSCLALRKNYMKLRGARKPRELVLTPFLVMR